MVSGKLGCSPSATNGTRPSRPNRILLRQSIRGLSAGMLMEDFSLLVSGFSSLSCQDCQ